MSPQTDKRIVKSYQTPAFRVSYPALFTPQAVLGNEAKKKYSLTMLFPKKHVAEALQAALHPVSRYLALDNCAGMYQEITAIARANFGPEVDLPSLKLTKFRDGDKPKTNGKIEENDKGYIIARTTTGEQSKPQCIRQDRSFILDPNELYPGCWARALVQISPFYQPTRGVTIYLVGVQKLADDTTFSSRPRVEDEFDAVVTDGNQSGPGAADASAMPWLE